jgi:hypothetical protein
MLLTAASRLNHYLTTGQSALWCCPSLVLLYLQNVARLSVNISFHLLFQTLFWTGVIKRVNKIFYTSPHIGDPQKIINHIGNRNTASCQTLHQQYKHSSLSNGQGNKLNIVRICTVIVTVLGTHFIHLCSWRHLKTFAVLWSQAPISDCNCEKVTRRSSGIMFCQQYLKRNQM